MTALAAWDADFAAVVGRIGPRFARTGARLRAAAYLSGLLGPAARKNSWQLAGAVGDAAPYGLVEGRWTSENRARNGVTIADGVLPRARRDDSATGRFTQPDPPGYDVGANLYAYAAGNPATLTDPSGLSLACAGVASGVLTSPPRVG